MTQKPALKLFPWDIILIPAHLPLLKMICKNFFTISRLNDPSNHVYFSSSSFEKKSKDINHPYNLQMIYFITVLKTIQGEYHAIEGFSMNFHKTENSLLPVFGENFGKFVLVKKCSRLQHLLFYDLLSNRKPNAVSRNRQLFFNRNIW